MATGRTWPPSLPQYPIQQGYSDGLPSSILRTEMDAGPCKVRGSAGLKSRPRPQVFLMTQDQLDTLESFITTTLSGGVLPFDMTHPIRRTAEEVAFVPLSGDKIYEATPAGELWYHVSMILEVLP